MYKVIGGDGKEYGPVTAEQVRQWRSAGSLNDQSQAQRAGETTWQALGTLPEFAAPPVMSAPPPLPVAAPARKAGMPAIAVVAIILACLIPVVAVVGLLAALAIPGFVKAKKQSQARQVINEARMVDNAIDQWALETNARNGATIDRAGVETYLKRPLPTTDILGNPYLITVVGPTQIMLHPATKAALDSTGIDWGPY